MPEIALDPFRACIFSAPQANEWAYRSQVALTGIFISPVTDIRKPYTLTDVIAFVCLVVFIFKLRDDQGQSRMTRLMRSILQDGVLYFLVMMGFHFAMLLFTVIGKVIPFLSLIKEFGLTSRRTPAFCSPSDYDHGVRNSPIQTEFVTNLGLSSLIPVMVSRLVISLRKTLDDSLVQIWDEDHFTPAGSDVHEMMDFAAPPPSQPPFLPIPCRNSKRFSTRLDLLDAYLEA